MENVTIFRNLYKSSDIPYVVPITKAIERIREGKSKDLIEKIRATKDKTKRDEIKKELPCILFNGEFSQRSKGGLKEHSGLLVFDLDDLDDVEKTKEDIKEIPFVVCCFVSPSGKGLKFVIRIPKCTAKEHEQYFKEFEKEYDYLNIDKSGKDVSRVCFESYDPDIHVNLKASRYEPTIIDEGFSNFEKVPLLPINDENDIINRIVNFNWKRGNNKGERNAFVFDLAGAFCEYGVSEHSAITYCLQLAQPDFQQREIETTVKSAYKRRTFGTKYFEDYKKIDSIKSDMGQAKKDVIKRYRIDEETYNEIKREVENTQFWTVEEKKNGEKKIRVDLLMFKTFLESSGFKKHFPYGATKPNFVKVISNKVEETSTDKIKDFVLDYLLEVKKEPDVWNYFASYSNLFSENILNMIETIELKTLRDTSEKSFFAFENGILEVTKDNINLLDYIDIDVFVWKDQIIKRHFKRIDKDNNDYKVFINNISRDEPHAFECAIGYLLSTYKNKMNNKAVILNDEVISDNPEGGTGKGVFIQGIKQLRTVAILDGKTFNDQKSFPYQTISQDTNVLVFDDVKQNFDFESKFSLITEGITLERKNKDAIKLTVEDSPKIVITTNYAIKGSGNSHKRRRHELELAQYYTGDNTPFDEFNRQLFDDWSKDDFLRFDNYMINCVQKYLTDGLIKQENAINIKTRHFIAETSQDFYNYMMDEFDRYNIRVDKKEELRQFQEMYPDYTRKWFTQNRFTIWLKKWSKFNGYEFEENTSNGQVWFMITKDKDYLKPSDDIPF